MLGTRRTMLFLLAVILLIAGMGISAQPAQASGCSYYHTVRPGQTLAWIARYYGAYWPYLAQINGIRAPRYIIYAGQVLCIAYGGGGYYPGPGSGSGGRGVVYPPSPYPYPYYGYRGIPTIWITGVARNSSVTIQTRNFPPNLDFQVLMGPMGTRGYGYYVTTFNSGGGGSMSLTFPIPPQLYGSYQVSIRTQNQWSGYHSYNWFYNNTTY